MKITRVRDPVDLAGSFYLLEIDKPEDLKVINEDKHIANCLRERWTRAYRNYTDEKGMRMQYFFHLNRWWGFLIKISTEGEFSVEEFLSFVKFKSGTVKKLTGEDAYKLISFLFKKCIDFSTWEYQSKGSYAVRRQNLKIEVVVPPEQYASLQGYKGPTYRLVLDQFHSSGIDLKVETPF